MDEIVLKNKKVVAIGDSRGIIIDRAYFANGQLNEDTIFDEVVLKKVNGKR